jgi:hypothetical protein
MWVLGFPADHIYPAGPANCIGCSDDPFGNKLTGNKASLHDPPAVFKVVSAERELPWDQINPDDDETWSWADAARFYSDGEWTHEQKVGFDAYRLALGLIHYFNALPQQNRLDCAGWAKDSSANGKTCLKPVFYVHDLGSTFGKNAAPLICWEQIRAAFTAPMRSRPSLQMPLVVSFGTRYLETSRFSGRHRRS